ncbi:MAG TPA: TMEM175 family protein [Candidatus Kapabacteria bacterium]|nr:TMEM175 family protein [Candidatus Kapabacteria bacterium]
MADTNPNTRLEAFSDGVFAIAITLLILDIKIPPTDHILTTSDFWLALGRIAPSIFTFILSFVVILISWVNHHGTLKLIHRSSALFIYANGFLLLTVAFLPFPTALLGEHILTDHSAPAVILYESVLALQAISWIAICGAALKDHLQQNERSAVQLRSNRKFGYYGCIAYSILAIIAAWFPLAVAIVTAMIWVFWLIFGMNIREE